MVLCMMMRLSVIISQSDAWVWSGRYLSCWDPAPYPGVDLSLHSGEDQRDVNIAAVPAALGLDPGQLVLQPGLELPHQGSPAVPLARAVAGPEGAGAVVRRSATNN